MMICNHCGQDIPETASRFGLSAQLSPPKVQYGGRELTDVQNRMLEEIVKLNAEMTAHRKSDRERFKLLETNVSTLTSSIAELRSDVAETKEVVQAWNAVTTGARFTKWLLAFVASVIAVVAAVKGFMHK